MAKRFLSLFMAVLMVAMSLTVMVSAASTYTTLGSILKTVENVTDSIFIAINETVYVDTDTTIPQNITVSIGTTGRLIVTGAKLTVYGKLNATESQLSVINGGYVYYPNAVPVDTNIYYYWTKYDANYPWTFYPVGGPRCTKCGQNSVTWCATCNTYHCSNLNCTSHYVSSVNYCNIHKCAKIQCTMCGEYYCPACEGGVHGYNTVSKKCVIIPYTKDSVCAIHKTALYYCENCKEYYCPTCEGGIHTVVNGKCVIYNGAVSTVCSKHNINMLYCKYCGKYYCPLCDGGYHVQNPSNPTKCVISNATDPNFYCSVHKCEKVFCAHCNFYYCPQCAGGYHIITGADTPCIIAPNGNVNPNYNNYYYYEYVFIPGYGYVAVKILCAAPTASIPSGSSVKPGTAVTLETSTPNGKIYYTLDGTTPTSKSILYTAPIVINSNMTIRAVTIGNGVTSSPVSTFSYKIKVAASTSIFSDIKSYPGLADVLDKLLNKKVITSSGKFGPDESVSWADLKEWFTAIGVKTDKIDSDFFADPDNITYEELIVASYRILFANKLIKNNKQNVDILKKFKYSDDITNNAITKAAFKSMLTNNALYGTNFKPQESATRVYLAFIIANFI